MTTPAPQPQQPPLIEHVTNVAGPCPACARLNAEIDRLKDALAGAERMIRRWPT